jgi:arylsulfatase A-like enzyme
MKRILVSVASFLCSLAVTAIAGEKPSKPNILFILVDDLGYGDLSCQGGTDIHTPHIDQLFSGGLRFSHFYASCTVCSPTRAALMTGCYPDMAGVPGVIRTQESDNWGYLLPSAVTLPDMMRKAGYQTALIGKWHLGLTSPNVPNQRGFDFFHGFLGDMMDDYYTHRREGFNYMRLNDKEVDPKGHATDVFTDWAVEYLNDPTRKKSPFFLYLAFNAPHFPIQPPQEWFEKVKQREQGITDKRAKNVALVEHLDAGIGRVMEALEKSGLMENTVIVFTSDNGGHLPSGASNGPLRGGKQDMYEGGIHVPACLVWKHEVPGGAETQQMGVTMDFYPTLCAIAGVPITHAIDGMNLLTWIRNPQAESVSRTVFFMRREGGMYGGLCYYAIRKGDMKLMQNTPYEAVQLFDIGNDPYEKIRIDDNASLTKELQFELSQHILKSGAIPWQKPR